MSASRRGPNPYSPPQAATDLQQPPAPDAAPAPAPAPAHVRIAGVLFAAAGLGHGMDAVAEIIRMRRFGGLFVPAFLLPAFLLPGVQLLIHAAEAAACAWLAADYLRGRLLRGRLRFRPLAIVLAALGFLGPTTTIVTTSYLSTFGGGARVWAPMYFLPGVFLIAVLALVVGRPSRPRFVVGIVFSALYALAAAGQLAYVLLELRVALR